MRFKNELERNITIKLGYANAKIYECSNPVCAISTFSYLIENKLSRIKEAGKAPAEWA